MAPEEWRRVSLRELVEIKHGLAFKGDYFRDEPPGDILLTPGNFDVGGGFKPDKLRYYDGPVPEEFVLNAGDLIVTMTDLSRSADTLGYPALVPDWRGVRFLHNQRLGKVEIRPGAPLLKDFLYFLLRTREYRHEVLAGATGTTVRHTSPERIQAFRFLLPSLPEQRAIAHILGTLDDKIELNRRMNETLEVMARAIFKSWFVDFDPVRAKMEGRQPVGMDAETAVLFPDALEDSALGRTPRGWGVAAIGEVVRCVGGTTPSTKEPSFWGGDIAFATPRDLASLQTPVLLRTERCITEDGLHQISSGLLPEGTVLLSSRAPIGYLAIAEIPVAVNQGFIAMVCDGPLPNLYVLNWAHQNMDIIETNANGTTFLEISKASFRPLRVLIPPPQALQSFVKQVESLYGRMAQNLRESETLAAIRNTLLPRLLSGEIRVKGAHHALTQSAEESHGATPTSSSA